MVRLMRFPLAAFMAAALPLVADAATARSLALGMSGPDVRELQQALIERGYLPADDVANDFARMNRHCDRIEIMAYDQGTVATRLNATRSAPYAPIADIVWVEGLVRLAAQTIWLGEGAADRPA